MVGSGIQVASWFGDDYQDTELLDLLGMLEEVPLPVRQSASK